MSPDSLRQTSKQLLGGSYRLEIAAALDSFGSGASAKELAEATGIPHPRVHEDLKRLESAGMLERLPRETLTVKYRPIESCYWQSCVQLMDELQAAEEPSAPSRT